MPELIGHVSKPVRYDGCQSRAKSLLKGRPHSPDLTIFWFGITCGSMHARNGFPAEEPRLLRRCVVEGGPVNGANTPYTDASSSKISLKDLTAAAGPSG